ncbi:4-hydroxybenzoate 3-monooxygenase [Actinomadura bangladeshensis]|uniref:4-hydroxybenzoate 3-monooxygenase n=1 Tax=Actinomadura bangladeshensis TaxID=453573 RepID=A0A4V6P9S9_9ACTN|nr:4-hydroxybenzoate 3-monooxygenase [Actinomadura bangladeshensis]TDC04906.1 4-hydroxybenzoate 3-monooxygenase [Actinomadura bangladeshensis]
MERTQVAIIGAGPAGLLLGRMLELAGVDAVILEHRTRAYVEGRIRAGMLEDRTARLLDELGLADRMNREAAVHHAFEMRFDRQRYRIPMAELTGGCTAVMYSQQEIVRDAIEARVASGLPLEFDVDDVRLDGVDTDTPTVRYRAADGTEHVLACDFIAGCDGFHGVSRTSIPAGVLTSYEHDYPFAWLGVLADVPPSTFELIYACHERGFALHSMRSSEVSRFYLQVPPDEDLAAWPEDRIWSELRTRLGTDDGWTLAEGTVTKKSITAMRSFVVEPMQYGRLFLAGDAAHIVPPTAAKGLNLAAADVRLLADALCTWYESGDDAALDRYSGDALRGVWRAQQFSRSMTSLLHHDPSSPMEWRLQHAELKHVCTSESAMKNFCENYVGYPPVGRIHRRGSQTEKATT